MSDGGVRKFTEYGSSSAFSAFVLCCPMICKNESFEDGKWMAMTMIPLLARVSIAPSLFGINQVDSNLVEVRALNPKEELLPLGLRSIHITDSQNVRKLYRELRESNKCGFRQYIRRLLTSVSKSEGMILEWNSREWNHDHNGERIWEKYHLPNECHFNSMLSSSGLNVMDKFSEVWRK